jgi:hypothetical protein
MDDRVWRLPGPRSFLADIVAELGRGRHVAVVLPAALAAAPGFADGVAVALLEEFASRLDAQRVYNPGPGRSVLDAFCEALIMGEPPATVPELLRHEQARDKVAVVVASDMSGAVAGELPRFLHRVELESHAGGYGRRLSIVAVVTREELPEFPGGTPSDIGLTSVWWWGRVARWDVAAHIAGLGGFRGANAAGVLADVRAESIVEVARWDLDLAERLADLWAGDPAELRVLLGAGCGERAPGDQDGQGSAGGLPLKAMAIRGTWDDLRPPDALLGSWDSRQLDRWHEQPSGSGHSLAATPGSLERAVWAAQARVLLPWVEERRSALLYRVKEVLGNRRFADVLQHSFEPPVQPDGSVEIGTLDRLVRITIGSADPELRDVARHLRQARNLLAHMTPLTLAQQEALVSACKTLLA